jgi:hypothetical protein
MCSVPPFTGVVDVLVGPLLAQAAITEKARASTRPTATLRIKSFLH